MIKTATSIILLLGSFSFSWAQNSMVGDGFGGRLWYHPTNYTVGSYSAYSICYDICGNGQAQLYGWGSNITNQLGLGISSPGTAIPTPIPNTNDVRYFSTGYIMGIIKNDETGWAWGNNLTGFPQQVITNAYFLDASAWTISFVKTDGTVWSIGGNANGNFGDGTVLDSPSIPIQMQGVDSAVRVANNYYVTTVLLADSTLVSVGSNFGGNLAQPSTIGSTYVPLPIAGLNKIIDIKSNALATLALNDDGDVYYWGSDMFYTNFVYQPTLVPGLSNIVAISACDDGYHFLALDSARNCYAWGNNWLGQCGTSSVTNADIPTPVLVATDVIDIMAGETFSYLVKSDGSLWASGGSSGESIWLNLPDLQREEFTELDPSQVAGACELIGITPTITPCTDSSYASISLMNYGGMAPYTYSIGGPYQNSPYFDSLGPGNYTITVQDVNGCHYQTNVTVQDNNCDYVPIPPVPEEAYIEFPNVFSPNQENENEKFFFPNQGLTKIDCKIYDRWGNLVYEWKDVNGFWNGDHTNGKPCSEGTYYYILTYELNHQNTAFHHGHVTLMR